MTHKRTESCGVNIRLTSVIFLKSMVSLLSLALYSTTIFEIVLDTLFVILFKYSIIIAIVIVGSSVVPTHQCVVYLIQVFSH